VIAFPNSLPESDFAKRFERGKLEFYRERLKHVTRNLRGEQKANYGFTGDVLQVISVVGRQQKSSKLLKRFAVGA
jgi:hypothetical protein